ncbi:hypothetical protein [Glaciimonas immobilis]|uniref:Uncharacterized protein n=1 Tax=Glaciimonas immobilis TaxID=728004 RepID=A0A840RYB8_9BURK|nr:hypothetical protein [Glaciimonas immobilis]KAF3997187.1 hypothetical protein HAV38_16130 [Glaciimonas immobilis]MBB5202222.1 hypothetical protein [Glaciimonas immobilis]
MRVVPAAGKPTISSACIGVFSMLRPATIWAAIRAHNGLEFPPVVNPIGPSPTRTQAPSAACRRENIASIGNDNPASLVLKLPSFSNIGSSILECGQKIVNALPFWPVILPTASAEVLSDIKPLRDWGHQKVGVKPRHGAASIATTTTTAPNPPPSEHHFNIETAFVKGPAWTPILQEATLKGIIAFQRWSPDLAPDVRLKGIATERPNDSTLDFNQLVDVFQSILPRLTGTPVLVNPYQFSVLKYAIQNQFPSGFSDVEPLDPARPQPVPSQATLQAEVARIFFCALGQISVSVGAEALRGLIRERLQIALANNPALRSLPALVDRIKAEIIEELFQLVPSLDARERATLNKLAKWFVEARLIAIDPLFSSRINLRHTDFGQTRYKSAETVLMRVGAGFINQFPTKSQAMLTPEILREVALHCLMDMDSKNWPRAVGAVLLDLGNALSGVIPGQPSASVADRKRAALAFLIAPEMEKIRRLHTVEALAKALLAKVNDQSNEDALHQQESADASRLLAAGKYSLYSLGLERMPLRDRQNILNACQRNQLRVYLPRAILSDGVAHKATFNAMSGLILRTGPTDVEKDAEYYGFSEARAWAAPVVYKVTQPIRKAGGINQYFSKNHAAFTSGISFSNQTRFETESVDIKAGDLDELALEVSDLQSYPLELNKKFSNLSPPQPEGPTGAEKFFHSKIYVLGETFIGFLPWGPCFIVAGDIAEMIFAPGKTNAEWFEQEIRTVTDGMFCATGMLKAGSTRALIRSYRPLMRYMTSETFAADKDLTEKIEQPHEADLESGLFDENVESAAATASAHFATPSKDLLFMTGITEFFDPSPLRASEYPDIILMHQNALNLPSNLVPEGVIQKSEGGPVFLVLSEVKSRERVGYRWNEAVGQMERQSNEWLSFYEKLIDRDPKVLALFTEDSPHRLSSTYISDRLYENKCFSRLHQQSYHSHIPYLLPEAERGVYTIRQQRYLKHGNKFYLLANTLESTATERIVGERMPADLQLDVYFDGTTWRITKDYLITPVLNLPESVTSFEGALKEGFNLPHGWEATGAYIDNHNSEQVIISFKDSEENTVFRRGPNQRNAFEELSKEDFDENQCNKVRRSPSNFPQASCSTLGAHISALSSEAARTAALDRIVTLDVEARPYYEREFLRLYVVRDAEKIRTLFEKYPGLGHQFFALISRMESKPTLNLPEAMQKMASVMQGRGAVAVDALTKLPEFWEKAQAQLLVNSAGRSNVYDPALHESVRLGLQFSKNLRSYSSLGRQYSEKIGELNRLDNAYNNQFIKPMQKLWPLLWRRVIGPVMTSRFINSEGWTYELIAKGISQTRTKFGMEVAHEISAVYSESHELAGQMMDWYDLDPDAFWQRSASFFHVSNERSPIGESDLVEAVSKFEDATHPVNMENLRVIAPSVNPEGTQYKYNVEEHAQGIPQEASLFGNSVAGYTYLGGKRQGKLFVTTTTFLSPTAGTAELGETLQHELAHLAVPDSAEEIYLFADRSKYGHYSTGGLRRQADVLLESHAAFLKYAEYHSSVTGNFLKHCMDVIPELTKRHFPEGISETNIDMGRFKKFLIALYEGPAHIKIKAFLMPDFYVGLFQHMAQGLPKLKGAGAAEAGAESRPQRDAPPKDWYAEMLRLLARDAFRSIIPEPKK